MSTSLSSLQQPWQVSRVESREEGRKGRAHRRERCNVEEEHHQSYLLINSWLLLFLQKLVVQQRAAFTGGVQQLEALLEQLQEMQCQREDNSTV
jgi:hypothetical protein